MEVRLLSSAPIRFRLHTAVFKTPRLDWIGVRLQTAEKRVRFSPASPLELRGILNTGMSKVQLCEQCGCEHSGTFATGRFCSAFCSRQFASLARRAEVNAKVSAKLMGRRRTLSETRLCQKCGEKFRHRHANEKYCLVCKQVRIRLRVTTEQELVTRLNNEYIPDAGALRSLLRRTREHRCVICNGTEWQGQPIPLVLDHIDGNSENNYPDNLRWVCANCDRFLPTFGSRNRGRGRKSRRLAKQRDASLFRKI